MKQYKSCFLRTQFCEPWQPWRRNLSKCALSFRILVLHWWVKSSLDVGVAGFTGPVWNGIFSLLICPRTLMKSFMEKIPAETVRKNHEMLPGGDLRSSNNLWVRSAWTHSELKVVPREKQIKMIFEKMDKKMKLCDSVV